MCMESTCHRGQHLCAVGSGEGLMDRAAEDTLKKCVTPKFQIMEMPSNLTSNKADHTFTYLRYN